MDDDPREADHADGGDAAAAGGELETERELRRLREDLDIPSRGAGVYVMLSVVASFAAVWGVLPILTGPVGIVLGLVGHLKGHRRGFAAAVIAGIATLVGMSVTWLFFSPFSG